MFHHLIIIFLCLVLSAFFSGMEIAFVSANRLHIELEKKQGNYAASIVSSLMEHPKRFITSMLVGNNISLVVYTIYMNELIQQSFFSYYPQFSGFLSVLITTAISTLIIIFLAEFIPKSLFNLYADRLILFFSFPIYLVYYSLFFIASFIIWLSEIILKFFHIELPAEVKDFDTQDIGFYISDKIEGIHRDEIDTEIHIFQNALEFSQIKAKECMIPRKEMVVMEFHKSIDAIAKKFTETGLSKIIIYRDHIDNIIGYVHSFELFKKPAHIKNILLPVEFVHETTSVKEILNRLTKKRKGLAIVLDEYGGTAGLITIEDIVEELFGDIEDEHDTIDLTEEKINDTEYLLSARLEIDYLNKAYDLHLVESEEYETLGGLIFNIAETIPEKGEHVMHRNYILIVEKVSDSRVEEVRLFIQE